MASVVKGYIVDIHCREIFKGSVEVENGVISRMNRHDTPEEVYILPGFVDSHVHIESSMLTPSHFASLAAAHGTVAVVADPHEIANVCGIEGIEYMIEEGRDAPLKIFYTVPSCVPATPFENAGARLGVKEVESLIARTEFVALGEMMNYPGVLHEDPEVMGKIQATLRCGKPVDGHAPMLSGEWLEKYIAAGISTDHEACTLSEAEEKIRKGMKIQIREGSSAKDFAALMPLLAACPDRVMFSRDDWKAVNLLDSHIDGMVRQALSAGYDLFNVLRAASLNPVEHYNLPVGLLRLGDCADFIVVDNLTDLHVEEVWSNGARVNTGKWKEASPRIINSFEADEITPSQLGLRYEEGVQIPVIGVADGSIVTRKESAIYIPSSFAAQDVCKVVVLNRYAAKSCPAVSFVRGMGLREGAIASSVAHDSHNIVAVGTSDEYLASVINLLIRHKGGIAARNGEKMAFAALPVGGIMSTKTGEAFTKDYHAVEQLIARIGTSLSSPLMTLSFLCLPVIPELRLTDRGLFDVTSFSFL